MFISQNNFKLYEIIKHILQKSSIRYSKCTIKFNFMKQNLICEKVSKRFKKMSTREHRDETSSLRIQFH